MTTTHIRYRISNPRVHSYKRKPQQKDIDIKVYRQLTSTTTSIATLTLRSRNQKVVEKTPWLKAAFWARLAELRYLESEAA